MSKDAQSGIKLPAEARKKFDECVAAMAACGFGSDGPPKETTFAEIEDFGHEVGRMLARAVDERLADQPAFHFGVLCVTTFWLFWREFSTAQSAGLGASVT